MTEELLAKLIREAGDCFGKKEYARELKLWRKIAKEKPDQAMWQHNIALALMNNGRFVEALQLFEELAEKYPHLSRVHNNRAVLLTRLGMDSSYLAPFYALALETSLDIPEFIRHLHNLCVSIAFGADTGAGESLDQIEKTVPSVLRGISRGKPLNETDLVSKRIITAFRKVASYREAFASRQWERAEREFGAAQDVFNELGYSTVFLSEIGKHHKLCQDVVGILERVGSDKNFTVLNFHENIVKYHAEAQSLREGKTGVMTVFLDIIGWFLFGCLETAGFLCSLEKPFELNEKPLKNISQLSAKGFTDIGQNCISFLQFFQKECVLLSRRIPTLANADAILASRDDAWSRMALFSNGLHFNFASVDSTLAGEILGWSIDGVSVAKLELQKFKLFIERQAHKDVFVDGKPLESIARGLLQAFLLPRSYREVKVRGGQCDLLAFTKNGKFLYETKIWRGKDYYEQGIREIEEYVIGEGDDPDLKGVFYVVFDPTQSGSAAKYVGDLIKIKTCMGRYIDIVVVSIKPPQPSKK